ncbi:MAG: RNA-binding S4 domain-containing protein [Brevinema sp.]
MRLDKWLKVALIFKQRSKAVDTIENNRVKVNGRVAKASTTLKIDDIITISRELGEYTYKVLSLMEKNVTTAMAREMYELHAPEEKGTEDEKFVKKLEKDWRKTVRKDWNKMHDDKKKIREVRRHKYGEE